MADGDTAYTKLEAVPNGDGTYSFKITPEQYQALVDKTGKVDVVKLGDVNFNGTISATDVSLAKRAVRAGSTYQFSALQKFAADVDGEEGFTTSDINKIREVAARFETFAW